MGKEAEFELDPLLDRQPVKLVQGRRHMIAWSQVHG